METTLPEISFFGIDVSKDHLDVFAHDTSECRLPNSVTGLRDLLTLLAEFTRPRVICEATGGYERLLVSTLLQAGVDGCVCNRVG